MSRRKPIIAVKAGRSQSGRRAAGSHTAALAASDVTVDALFHQTGVIRAESLDEMLALAAGLSAQPLTVTDAADIARGILTGIDNGRKGGVKAKPVFIGWMAEGNMDRTFNRDNPHLPLAGDTSTRAH